MSASLPQLVTERPEVAEILSSPAQHTEVAKRLTELGYPTTEASVRRWRARQSWSASREMAVAELSTPVVAGPSVADQGYLLAEALRSVELPDDPVTVLGYLDQYIGPDQHDLRAVRRTDSDGITTVTVTAVRDDFAEAAAGLMATRIATGEGDHRCLKRHKDGNATVFLWSGPWVLFARGASAKRYERFSAALIRKLRSVGWECCGRRENSLTFRPETSVVKELLEQSFEEVVAAAQGRTLSDHEIQQARAEDAERHRQTAVLVEGL